MVAQDALKTMEDIFLKTTEKSKINQELLDLIISSYNAILKQEAIKWVRHIKPKGDRSLWTWIIRFFNFTEEELKECSIIERRSRKWLKQNSEKIILV
ncbi:MAG: hypothetical protein AABY22_24220 [Nanoarchaeota archaeon]|mgnify:FL=1